MYKNRVTLIGNVSQAPVVRTTKNGTEVCNFSVATNHIYYDKNGEKITTPEYHSCSAWDKMVSRVEVLQIGQQVEIEGRVKENNWPKACPNCGEEVTQYRYEVQVQNVLYLSKKNENT